MISWDTKFALAPTVNTPELPLPGATAVLVVAEPQVVVPTGESGRTVGNRQVAAGHAAPTQELRGSVRAECSQVKGEGTAGAGERTSIGRKNWPPY